MSYINCPECRKIISDRVSACPDCGFPIGRFTDPAKKDVPDDEISYAVFPEVEEPEDDATYIGQADFTINDKTEKLSEKPEIQPKKEFVMPERYVNPPAKKRRIFAAAAIAALALAICSGVIISLSINRRSHDTADKDSSVETVESAFENNIIPDINICVTRTEYNKCYLELESSCEDPFVAVIEDCEYTELMSSPFYYYVFMKDGKGSCLLTTDSDDSDYENKFAVAGYLEGQEITDSDITNISHDIDLKNNKDVYHTSADIRSYLTIDNYDNGLLYYELPVMESRRSDTGGFIPIHNGKGVSYDYVYDLDYGTKSINIKMDPVFFIPCEELDKTDYSILSEFTVDKAAVDTESSTNEYDAFVFSGTIETLDEFYSDGIVLYNYNININSMDLSDKTGFAAVTNNSSDIKVKYAFPKSDNISMDSNDLQIDFFGFIKLNKIP